MLFDRETKVANVVMHNYRLLRVMQRMNIPFDFGEKNVSEVCQEQGIDFDFFLTLINAYCDPEFFPDEELQNVNPLLLIDYLQQSHQDYIQNDLPHITEHFESFLEWDRNAHTESFQLFFEQHVTVLTTHFDYENDIVFPYLRIVYEATQDIPLSPQKQKLLDSYSVKEFISKHEDPCQAISDLIMLLLKCIRLPKRADRLFQLLQTLFHFRTEMYYHLRLEERVLSRIIAKLEEQIPPL